MISLTATLLTRHRRHFLAFRLTNVSKRPIRTYPFELPWGNPYSICVAAFTTDGQQLQGLYPLADPPFEDPITIAPGQTLRGRQCILVDKIDEPRRADVVVLWSYDPLLSAKGDERTAICSGAVVIPGVK